MIRPISDAIRVGPVVHKSVTLQVLSLAMHQQEMRRISYVHSYLKNFGHSARHGAFSLIGIALKNPYFAPFFQRNFLALIPCL